VFTIAQRRARRGCRDEKKTSLIVTGSEGIELNFLSLERLCRNATNHLDVMLSESEASAFPTGY
jgi:hypothetical protein